MDAITQGARLDPGPDYDPHTVHRSPGGSQEGEQGLGTRKGLGMGRKPDSQCHEKAIQGHGWTARDTGQTQITKFLKVWQNGCKKAK